MKNEGFQLRDFNEEVKRKAKREVFLRLVKRKFKQDFLNKNKSTSPQANTSKAQWPNQWMDLYEFNDEMNFEDQLGALDYESNRH